MSDNISVPASDITPVIEELIADGVDVRLAVNGNSMFPMLHSKLDSVVLTKADRELKKYDLPLYKRESGQYVMHRVVRVKKGIYTMNGDNQIKLETPIYPEQICALVKSFYRNGRLIDCNNRLYRLYCVLWVALRPLRKLIYNAYAHSFARLRKRRKK